MGKSLYRLALAQESMSQELRNALQQLGAASRGETVERRKMAEEFLPLVDALHRLALALANQGNQPLAEGARIVAAKGDAYLAALGVQVITSVGEAFDPRLHQALEARPSSPELQGRVIEEIVRGYRIGSRVLRTAQVVVGKER
jgi:molecular chaperone GrpE